MKRIMVLLGVVALMAGAACGAVKPGDMYVDFLGGWTSLSIDDGGDGSDSVDVLYGMAGVSKQVTPNILAGVAGTYGKIDLGATDLSLYGLALRGVWCFNPDAVGVWYAGVQGAWVSADAGTTIDGMMYGPVGGYRHEVTPTTDLFVEAQYHLFTGDLGDMLDYGYMITFGASHQW